MSPELIEKVADAAQKTGLAQADIMRLALAIGLEDLRRIDYKLSSTIAVASNQSEEEILKVAESHLSKNQPTPAINTVQYPMKKTKGLHALKTPKSGNQKAK